jgi:predicted ATP-grasp superfamily ATP-dependent carboligase
LYLNSKIDRLKSLFDTAKYWSANLFPNVKKSWVKSRERRRSNTNGRGLSILFGCHPGWEPTLKKAFADTQHRIHFEQFSETNIGQYDLVIPITIDEILFLDTHRALLRNSRLPVASSQAVRICDDKLLFYQTMVQKGFGAYLPQVGGKLAFPYLLKKKVTHCGHGSELVFSVRDEERLVALLTSDEYFRQAYIPGNCEYATHILFRKGRIVASFTIRHRHSAPVYIRGFDKAASVYSVFTRSRFLPLFSGMLQSINFEGICCFDYKIADNKPYILEINPRIGGSSVEYLLKFINAIDAQEIEKTTVSH